MILLRASTFVQLNRTLKILAEGGVEKSMLERIQNVCEFAKAETQVNIC